LAFNVNIGKVFLSMIVTPAPPDRAGVFLGQKKPLREKEVQNPEGNI